MRSMTIDESWEDWAWTLTFNHSILIWETEAGGSLCIQRQPSSLHVEFQDSQEYVETLSQKKKEEREGWDIMGVVGVGFTFDAHLEWLTEVISS